jgi:HEAT repeat protein
MNTLLRARSFLLVLLIVAFVQPLPAQEGDNAAKEAELLKVLQSGAPADKAIACKQLTIYGSEKAVPELAKLLADEQLASWARIALEAIPGPAADEALRASLESLDGKLLVGAINSLGVRRDAGAVEALASRLQHESADVALASAVALGRIGSVEAAAALQPVLSAESAAQRAAAAEGCIYCAEQLLARGSDKAAADLYDKVRAAEVPKPRKLEATRGAIVARGAAGVPLLVEQLNSPDKQFMQIALGVARELPGAEFDEALAGELAQAKPDRAALLMYALADRKLASIPAGVVKAAASGEKQVRIAALDLIGRRGSAANLAALLPLAADADAEVAQAAKEALVKLPGDDVNEAITARLSQTDSKTFPILIALVGERRIDAVAPLKKALADPQKKVRLAALAALGETVGQKDLAVLIEQVVSPKQADQAEEAQQALQAACIRMPDREACAAELTAAMQKAPLATKARLLEILGAMQGKKALDTIAVAVKGNNELLIDTGSRVLGDWMSVDAAPVLLDVAQKSENNKYKIRALRGYLRFARQFPMPARDRAEMCEQALAAAIRAEERQLVLEVLERYPSGDTLRLAAKAAANPAMKQEANRVAAAIAQKLGGPSASVPELLAVAGREPMKIEVLKAVYGSGDQQRDVTELLQQQVGNSPLVGLPKPTYNDNFGGDPAPNAKKTLHVQYTINGKPGEVSLAENAPLILPLPK